MKFRYKSILLSSIVSTLIPLTGIAANIPQDMGATAPAQTQTVSIVMKLHNVPHLEKFIAGTVNPNSWNYQKFLSVEEFVEHYAPSERDIKKVVRELNKLGITVDEVYRNHMVIRATGTTAQLNQFFSTELHHYQESNQRYIKPNRNITVPDSVSDVVLTVTGMNTKKFASPHSRILSDALPGKASGDLVKSTSLNAASTGNPLGKLTVADVANLYNINPLYAKKSMVVVKPSALQP